MAREAGAVGEAAWWIARPKRRARLSARCSSPGASAGGRRETLCRCRLPQPAATKRTRGPMSMAGRVWIDLAQRHDRAGIARSVPVTSVFDGVGRWPER